MIHAVAFVAMLAPAYSFVVPSTLRVAGVASTERGGVRMSAEGSSNRANFLAASAVAVASAAVLPVGVLAADGETSTAEGAEAVSLVTSKLGGQLEPFADVSKGYRLAKPLGWNRYDGTTGEYAVKMVDLVDPTTVILLTNSPVKSDTELSTLGSLSTVAEKLSKGRGLELVYSRERITEGVRLYDFEFKGGDRRELKTLTVNKNKLWNLTLGCPEKAWKKREELYKTIVDSFLPRL